VRSGAIRDVSLGSDPGQPTRQYPLSSAGQHAIPGAQAWREMACVAGGCAEYALGVAQPTINIPSSPMMVPRRVMPGSPPNNLDTVEMCLGKGVDRNLS
jgi:hypothetical protein